MVLEIHPGRSRWHEFCLCSSELRFRENKFEISLLKIRELIVSCFPS